MQFKKILLVQGKGEDTKKWVKVKISVPHFKCDVPVH